MTRHCENKGCARCNHQFSEVEPIKSRDGDFPLTKS